MTTPRWLSSQEQEIWRAFLSAGKLVLDQLDRDLQRDTGIPHAYYEILVRLSEAPERTLRMSALADRSQSSRSRLSHAVSRLEENGWVTREPCSEDRRGLTARLTEAGFDALAAAAPAHVESVRARVFDPLTPAQQQAMLEISDALLAALAADPRARRDGGDQT